MKRTQSSVNTLGHNSHPAPLLLPLNVVFCFGTVTSTQCSRYERPLQAMGVKGKGRAHFSELTDRFAMYKNSDGGRVCKEQLLLHSWWGGGTQSSTTQMRARRHIRYRAMNSERGKVPSGWVLFFFQHLSKVPSEKTNFTYTFCSFPFFHPAETHQVSKACTGSRRV